MRRHALSIGAAAALVAAPHVAGAICGLSPPVHTLPRRGVAAPLNAHVVVSRPSASSGYEVTLTTAPARGAAERARIAVKRSVDANHAFEHVELVPAAPLLPRTAYEVWGGGAIVGAFTTGDATDTSAPTWAGARGGKAYVPPKANAQRTTSRVIRLAEECGEPYVEIESIAPAADDQTPENDIRYALWAGDPKAALDYGKPPFGWCTIDVAAQRSSTLNGRQPIFVLRYGNTEGLDDDLRELPPMRPLLVGVRAIDLAGNASAPSELVVK